jgi:hypothetical protein
MTGSHSNQLDIQARMDIGVSAVSPLPLERRSPPTACWVAILRSWAVAGTIALGQYDAKGFG